MMINADAKNARVHFRHEFGVLGLFFVRDETRAKAVRTSTAGICLEGSIAVP